MQSPDDILRRNIDRLMQARWGKSNQLRLAKISGAGLATAQRLKEGGKTGFRLATVAKLAACFDLQPWQLLLPDLDPDLVPQNPAHTSAEAVEIDRMLDQMKTDAARRRAVALVKQTIQLLSEE